MHRSGSPELVSRGHCKHLQTPESVEPEPAPALAQNNDLVLIACLHVALPAAWTGYTEVSVSSRPFS